jgi:hypothetical protein
MSEITVDKDRLLDAVNALWGVYALLIRNGYEASDKEAVQAVDTIRRHVEETIINGRDEI